MTTTRSDAVTPIPAPALVPLRAARRDAAAAMLAHAFFDDPATIRLPDRRVLVGGVLAVVILVSIVAALVGRLAASPDTTVAPATVGDLAAFSPSIVGDASLLDASTAGFLPSGYSDWFAGDQSRAMSLTEPGLSPVRMAVSELATFSPSIVGDASRSAVPSVALPTGYSEWMGGDQSRERAVSE